MKKWFKRLGIGLVALIAVVGIVVFALHKVGTSRLANAPSVTGKAISVPTDQASVTRGGHLATISSCSVCHGAALRGETFLDQAPFGYLPAPNLTAGKGGIGKRYTNEDWERAIRHGVAQDGRTIVIMPADHYSHYSDEDLGALIAYLKSLPPVDNDTGPRNITFPGTVIFGVLAYGSWPVSVVDHNGVGGPVMPAVEESPAYGEYLVSLAACRGCHGAALDGNLDGGGPPPGPNLTPGGALASWTRDDFAAAIRTGLTPDNRVLIEEMPWRNFAHMTDVEVGALWAYLRSLDPIE